MSRNHARLTVARGAAQIEDLGSANGTAVNGVIVLRAPLTPGDTIRVGNSIVQLRDERG